MVEDGTQGFIQQPIRSIYQTNKVKKVTLNIKNETATIYLIENKNLSDKEIKGAIADAGYEIGSKDISRK